MKPCNKQTYPDKKAALSARNKSERRVGRDRIKIYHCGRCRGWHLAKRDIIEF